MPRICRGIFPHYPYHILNRGNAKQKIFHKDADYQNFIHLIAQAKERHPLKIFSFCLMPNHFHMCVTTDHPEDISKFMQWLLTSHVRRTHTMNKTSGHIWQGRFKSFLIQEDTHLLTVMRYIEANPLRAKLVSHLKNWPWSSLLFRNNTRNLIIIDKPPILLPKNWENFVNSYIPSQELENIRLSIQRQSPFGKEDWIKKVAVECGLLSTINPRGRPPKIKK